MNSWLAAFMLLVTAVTAARLWLGHRQCAHVCAHRDAVPEPFRDRITLRAHRKAADYTLARQSVARVEAVYAGALALAWTAGGGLAALDALWRGPAGGPLLHGLAVILSFVVVIVLLGLPFSAWRTFVVEERFGFNRTEPALFAADALKQLVLALLLTAPLAAASLWLMANSEHWWLWVALAWTGFMLMMLVLGPRLIAPLFNRFRPLEDPALRERIERLLERCGFQTRGVYVMDASRRSSHGNAYFTGVGRSRRIVFYDTLLEELEPPEIEAVLAHELGHFRLRHVPRRIALSAVGALFALAALDWLASRPGFFTGLGVPAPSDHAALLLFFIAGSYAAFFLTPAFAWLSRRDELQADAFAADRADATSLARALVKLTEENARTLTPDPVHSAFYDSHPPVARRIGLLESGAA